MTYEEAVALLPEGEEIHTYRQSASGMMLGASWERAAILEGLRSARQIARTRGQVLTVGHGLAFRDARGWVFVETREEAG